MPSLQARCGSSQRPPSAPRPRRYCHGFSRHKPLPAGSSFETDWSRIPACVASALCHTGGSPCWNAGQPDAMITTGPAFRRSPAAPPAALTFQRGRRFRPDHDGLDDRARHHIIRRDGRWLRLRLWRNAFRCFRHGRRNGGSRPWCFRRCLRRHWLRRRNGHFGRKRHRFGGRRHRVDQVRRLQFRPRESRRWRRAGLDRHGACTGPGRLGRYRHHGSIWRYRRRRCGTSVLRPAWRVPIPAQHEWPRRQSPGFDRRATVRTTRRG